MKVLRVVSGGLTSLILLAGLVAIGAWVSRISIVKRAEAEETARKLAVAAVPVKKGEFQVVVEAVGKLAAVNSRQVIAEVTGQIVHLAPNGTEVKKGDIVAELDAPRMFRRLRDQEREYDDAQQSLERQKRSLEAEVEKAQISLDKAKSELQQYQAQQTMELASKESEQAKDEADLQLARQRYERQKKLADEGLIPKREIELAETEIKAKEFALERETKDLELARAKKETEELNKKVAVTTAESDLERAKSKQDDELRNATSALEIRKTQLARVQDEFSKSIIRAPADGIVVLEQEWQGGGMQRRPIQPGDRVWEGRSFASIPDLSEMRVEIELFQEKARSVKPKRPAVITVDALPGRTFKGEVTEVSQTANESTLPGTGIPRGDRTFQARISIKDLKKARLRPGMSAQVRIIVETIPQAVSVPLECVFERDGSSIVYVRHGREFRPVEVELGAKNDTEAVVTKGLKGGEEVSLRDVGETALPSSEPAGEVQTGPLPPQGNSG